MNDEVCEHGRRNCFFCNWEPDIANQNPAGDPRFHALLKQLGELYDRKQADYGTPDDPFANYRASEDIGIPAWKNAFMRGIEKVNRIKAFIRNGSLKNEGVEDAFMDLAVCSMIALIEYRETVKNEKTTS